MNKEQWDTSVYLVWNQYDSYIQGMENSLTFFTNKWPKVTPSKPHKRTLKHKLYKYPIQNSSQSLFLSLNQPQNHEAKQRKIEEF